MAKRRRFIRILGAGSVSVPAALTGLLLLLPASARASAPAPSGLAARPAARGSGELLYVASAGGPVDVYRGGSSGRVAPVSSIPDPKVSGTVWDPWGLAFDPAGDLFVQSFISDATTFVFPWGSTSPSRIFRVSGPDSRSIAVDPAGDEYVATGESAAVVYMAAPGASGTASDGYSVPPVRTITTAETGFEPWPSTLAADRSGDLVVAVLNSHANAVEVFAGGAGGSGTPVRFVTGPSTGLGTCTGFDTCDHLSLAVSPKTGDLFVAVSASGGARIEQFAPDANGDAAPLRTITGSKTGLEGQVVTGLSVGPRRGDLYAMVKPGPFTGTGHVEVFAPNADGDAAPVRTFTDGSTGFDDALGIGAVSPPRKAP
ncbi:MAG: hypothetical protein JO368_13265 [Acidimicrobiales bacterium]|nr:hypothetical protein [Acidimicrobiales bacterium]